MIDVLELREGLFEISDTYRNEDRNRLKLLQSGIRIAITLLLISFFASFFISSIIAKIIVILLCGLGIGGLLYLDKQFKSKLPKILNGFVLEFTPEKKVHSIKTRYWLEGSTIEFLEEEVRFNQAIGFMAKIDSDGDLLVELIVDPDFRGTLIFTTYSMDSLAELNLMLQEVLPNLDVWLYRKWDNSEWDQGLKDEFNEAIQNSRVPWQIRKYFDFKIQSWT